MASVQEESELVSNPRDRTVELLDDLIGAMREFLHVPNIDHLLFALAVAISATLDGDPLWGLLVGPPSSGKTEALRALDKVADEHVTEVTAPGLLSWTIGRNPHPTGLLTRVGSVAFATMADLSPLLAASDRGQRDLLYALLRRAYDGEVTRDLGNAPGPLSWIGRLTLLGAVTPSIDTYSSHTNALGPRWLYLRLPETDTAGKRAASRLARKSAENLSHHRSKVCRLASEVVRDARHEVKFVTVPDALALAIDDAAIVACYARAAVERDGGGRREIRSMPIVEEPPRLVGQLQLLARGLLALGLEESDAIGLCRRAALDSTPQARRRALASLADGAERTAAEIARIVGCDRKVVQSALEELASIGICRHRGDERDDADTARIAKPWRLSGPDKDLVAGVFGADLTYGGTKSVIPPTSPPRKMGGSDHVSSHGDAIGRDRQNGEERPRRLFEIELERVARDETSDTKNPPDREGTPA